MATLSYKSAHLVYLHASIYYVVERFLAELIQLKTDRLWSGGLSLAHPAGFEVRSLKGRLKPLERASFSLSRWYVMTFVNPLKAKTDYLVPGKHPDRAMISVFGIGHSDIRGFGFLLTNRSMVRREHHRLTAWITFIFVNIARAWIAQTKLDHSPIKMLPLVNSFAQADFISLVCQCHQWNVIVKDAKHHQRRLVLVKNGTLVYLSNITSHHSPDKTG